MDLSMALNECTFGACGATRSETGVRSTTLLPNNELRRSEPLLHRLKQRTKLKFRLKGRGRRPNER
jgi:hypothetical protein